MVYFSRQLKRKRESQRRIWEFILLKSNPFEPDKNEPWASFADLLNGTGLSRRALSRNLKEMLKPDAEFPLIKTNRLEVYSGLARPLYNPNVTEKNTDLLWELYIKQDNLDPKKLPKDYRTEKFLRISASRDMQTWSETKKMRFFRHLEKTGKRFYRKREFLRRYNKFYNQFDRMGYSIRRPEIIHGSRDIGMVSVL